MRHCLRVLLCMHVFVCLHTILYEMMAKTTHTVFGSHDKSFGRMQIVKLVRNTGGSSGDACRSDYNIHGFSVTSFLT